MQVVSGKMNRDNGADVTFGPEMKTTIIIETRNESNYTYVFG